MTEACSNCRFWDAYEQPGALHPGTIGDCRRHPPIISQVILAAVLPGGLCDPREELEHSVYPASAFPVTEKGSWCGEYQDKAAVAW